MISHAQAAQIVRAAWRRVHGREPTANEAALVQAVAYGESQYGRSPGQHARWASEGKFTWGNLETLPKDGVCPAGTVPGKDAGHDRCFYVDSTDEDAAVRFIRNLTASGGTSSQRARDFATRSANIMAALASGSADALAHAMRTPASVAYYEAEEAKYAALIKRSLMAMGQDREHPIPDPNRTRSNDSTTSPILILTLFAGVIYFGVRYGPTITHRFLRLRYA
jgi:hypothetical protein